MVGLVVELFEVDMIAYLLVVATEIKNDDGRATDRRVWDWE